MIMNQFRGDEDCIAEYTEDMGPLERAHAPSKTLETAGIETVAIGSEKSCESLVSQAYESPPMRGSNPTSTRSKAGSTSSDNHTLPPGQAASRRAAANRTSQIAETRIRCGLQRITSPG